MDEYIERGALMQFPIRHNHYDRKNGKTNGLRRTDYGS